ncbi:MAG TPA: ATP-binding cassette domain-containing protein [Burkholderiales bacterium]|nr:ATP-binding cassette domain-containing protein [Burkholderiales bacterium]
MALLNLIDAQLAYGALPLLDRASFSMESGERIGLIGRNGTGKSSLLGVIAGTVTLDDGEIRKSEGVRVVRVEQEPAFAMPAEYDYRFESFLDRFGMKVDELSGPLSGGQAKRASLAWAFAQEPDLLLLDEPTNHLDLDGILVLEGLLNKQTAIVITHDRAFLDRTCTRILELDRGRLISFPGNFTAYQERKEALLANEAVAARKFDKFWAEEEVWIRKGVQARNVRNQGRVRRLERLREERAARRERVGNVKLTLGAGQRSGKLVCEMAGVSKSFSSLEVVKNLDLIVSRGDRLGLIGPNGAGKTTLIKLILGELQPDSGTVRLGANVQPAYFDQLREQLDEDKTVAETIAPGSEWVELPTGRKHVMSYLADFLFPPRRAQSKVSMLSGGERNRLLLARLFARPANVLVLDEPTNDLDIESLELLEEALQDYEGTLLLVSHDRAFLDNVVTSVLAAEGGGKWKEYVGGYSDWLRQRPAGSAPLTRGDASPRLRGDERGVPKPKKLSYKETRELESLPKEIEALEAEQHMLAAKMTDPDYYKQPAGALRADQARTSEIEVLLMQKLERWESLEAKSRG